MKDQSKSIVAKMSFFTKLQLVLVIIALCALLFSALSEKFQWFRPKSSYTVEEFKKEVLEKSRYYQEKNNAAYEEFQREIQNAGKKHFRTAARNVKKAVKEISKFATSAKLVGMIVKDKFKKTNTAQQKVSGIISPLIVSPCTSGAAEINDVLKKFLLQVQENDNQFHAECAQKLEKLPKGNNQKAAEKFVREIGTFHDQTSTLMQKYILTAIGTGIEVVLIRQTFSAFARLTAKITAKLGISAALSLADGPGILFDTFALVGAGWAGYELYDVLKVMPDKMEKTLFQAIRTCQNDMRKNAIRQAAKAYQMSKKNMENITQKVQENSL
ncbi:MAG: hypothetical protein IKB25_05065 [Lentisphaeria bacterium]|nr:hypothetical protein [Lentisphaeria bacterium]